jgi:preprotein translocase subunit SecG
MTTVLLLLHLLIAVSLVGVVLLQRSEGGGLGIGGGGSSFMSGRGTANLLTRATAGLAAAFFLTSIGLTVLARQAAQPVSPLDAPISGQPAQGKGGILDSLEQGKQKLPAIPKSN